MTHAHRSLDHLASRIRACGALTEDLLRDAVAALVNRDAALADVSMEIAPRIAAEMTGVEDECLAILAQHRPVAADLRFVLAVLRLANDLASIAELGHAVARQVHEVAADGPRDLPPEMRSLGVLAVEMVHDAVAAVADRDCRRARGVLLGHAAVRRQRREVCRWTIRQVRAGSAGLDGSLHVGWIARTIEQIAAIAAGAAVDLLATLENWPIAGCHHEDADEPKPAPLLR